jgi:hypothetical protein
MSHYSNNCQYDPSPSREEEGKGKGDQCSEDRIEINLYARLSTRSIVICLITIGVVTVLTLLAMRCIELYLSG